MTSPMLDQLTFSRYRAFDHSTALELRPLTLVFGYNNTGKSAAVRLLPGLAESIEHGGDPLHLRGQVFREASFGDISHGGGLEVRFGLRWPPPAALATLDWILRADPKRGEHWVDELQIARHDGASLGLIWSDQGDTGDVYTAGEGDPTDWYSSGDDHPGAAQSIELRFTGLLPARGALASTPWQPFLDAAWRQVEQVPKTVRWITGHRGEVGRSRQVVSSPPRRVLFDAGAAADVLVAAERELTGSALLDEVNRVYGEIGREESARTQQPPDEPIHRLAVTRPNAGRYSLTLTRGDSSHPSNLVDTGEGMTQVLPIAVALGQIACKAADAPRVLCIEQPELHLHPRAQHAIADRLVDIAREHDNRLLVETHAHHVMLAVQVALAEGRLDPSRVLVYWARQTADGRSTLERVELDHLGRNLEGRWPPDVFNDDAQMARRLITARRNAR